MGTTTSPLLLVLKMQVLAMVVLERWGGRSWEAQQDGGLWFPSTCCVLTAAGSGATRWAGWLPSMASFCAQAASVTLGPAQSTLASVVMRCARILRAAMCAGMTRISCGASPLGLCAYHWATSRPSMMCTQLSVSCATTLWREGGQAKESLVVLTATRLNL